MVGDVFPGRISWSLSLSWLMRLDVDANGYSCDRHLVQHSLFYGLLNKALIDGNFTNKIQNVTKERK